MNKPELLKHLQRVAVKSSAQKKLNGRHVRAITDELVNVWATSMRETGTASMSGLGRFDVRKGKGTIKFTPSKLWMDAIAGDVSSSAKDERDEGDDSDSDSGSDSDSDDEDSETTRI